MLTQFEEREGIGCAEAGTAGAESSSDFVGIESAIEEIQDLRRALRESRTRLRRGAWESTRQIAGLNAEVSRLQKLCANYQHRLEGCESGAAIVELGRELVRLSDNNDRLKGVARRVLALEKSVEAAHAECLRLSIERDTLDRELQRLKQGGLAD